MELLADNESHPQTNKESEPLSKAAIQKQWPVVVSERVCVRESVCFGSVVALY